MSVVIGINRKLRRWVVVMEIHLFTCEMRWTAFNPLDKPRPSQHKTFAHSLHSWNGTKTHMLFPIGGPLEPSLFNGFWHIQCRKKIYCWTETSLIRTGLVNWVDSLSSKRYTRDCDNSSEDLPVPSESLQCPEIRILLQSTTESLEETVATSHTQNHNYTILFLVLQLCWQNSKQLRQRKFSTFACFDPKLQKFQLRQ